MIYFNINIILHILSYYYYHDWTQTLIKFENRDSNPTRDDSIVVQVLNPFHNTSPRTSSRRVTCNVFIEGYLFKDSINNINCKNRVTTETSKCGNHNGFTNLQSTKTQRSKSFECSSPIKHKLTHTQRLSVYNIGRELKVKIHDIQKSIHYSKLGRAAFKGLKLSDMKGISNKSSHSAQNECGITSSNKENNHHSKLKELEVVNKEGKSHRMKGTFVSLRLKELMETSSNNNRKDLMIRKTAEVEAISKEKLVSLRLKEFEKTKDLNKTIKPTPEVRTITSTINLVSFRIKELGNMIKNKNVTPMDSKVDKTHSTRRIIDLNVATTNKKNPNEVISSLLIDSSASDFEVSKCSSTGTACTMNSSKALTTDSGEVYDLTSQSNHISLYESTMFVESSSTSRLSDISELTCESTFKVLNEELPSNILSNDNIADNCIRRSNLRTVRKRHSLVLRNQSPILVGYATSLYVNEPVVVIKPNIPDRSYIMRLFPYLGENITHETV